MRRTVSGLYAVTPALADSALLRSKVEAALRGGARILQYRNKAADEQLRREQAFQIAWLCRDAGACFIVNDSIELAHDVAAEESGSACDKSCHATFTPSSSASV